MSQQLEMPLVAILCSWIINYTWLKRLDDVFLRHYHGPPQCIKTFLYLWPRTRTSVHTVCIPSATHVVYYTQGETINWAAIVIRTIHYFDFPTVTKLDLNKCCRGTKLNQIINFNNTLYIQVTQRLKRLPLALYQVLNKPAGRHLTIINKVWEYLPPNSWQANFTCPHNSTTGLNLKVRSHLQKHLFARSLCNNIRKQWG